MHHCERQHLQMLKNIEYFRWCHIRAFNRYSSLFCATCAIVVLQSGQHCISKVYMLAFPFSPLLLCTVPSCTKNTGIPVEGSDMAPSRHNAQSENLRSQRNVSLKYFLSGFRKNLRKRSRELRKNNGIQVTTETRLSQSTEMAHNRSTEIERTDKEPICVFHKRKQKWKHDPSLIHNNL